MNNAVIRWDTLSLKEKEVFITRAGLDLVEELYSTDDAKGLSVFCKNMNALTSFMQCRVDHLAKRSSIIDRFTSTLEYLMNNGVDNDFLEAIEDISTLTQDFLSSTHEDGSDGCDDEDAYTNIKAAMKKEEEEFLTAWEAQNTSDEQAEEVLKSA